MIIETDSILHSLSFLQDNCSSGENVNMTDGEVAVPILVSYEVSIENEKDP